jgi:Flp pilus assembly pilin Flp
MAGMKRAIFSRSGQANVEYALLLILLALAIIAALVFFGAKISSLYTSASSKLPAETQVPNTLSTNKILADFKERILAYYQKNGHWPRTFSPYNFTDIGLNPDDWSKPVNGLYFSPHGNEVGIANRKDDKYQLYVNDLNGKTLKVYDGWGIWCPVNTTKCYYHTVSPGNEVDINTLVVTSN